MAMYSGVRLLPHDPPWMYSISYVLTFHTGILNLCRTKVCTQKMLKFTFQFKQGEFCPYMEGNKSFDEAEKKTNL